MLIKLHLNKFKLLGDWAQSPIPISKKFYFLKIYFNILFLFLIKKYYFFYLSLYIFLKNLIT